MTITGTDAPNELVSIVLPIHNAERYLAVCLDSILAQTHRAIEVIAVDDGSDDASLSIATRYARDDERVQVISQKGSGVSAARNRALDVARGLYVAFVDADDYVSPLFIESALGRARTTDADMTVVSFNQYYDAEGLSIPFAERAIELPDDRGVTLSELPVPATEILTPNVWRILFKRSILAESNARFDEHLRSSEDFAFIYALLFRGYSVAVLQEHLYYYRRDVPGSLTRSQRGLDGMMALDTLHNGIRDVLPAHGRLEYQFINIALDIARYSMESAADYEEYRALDDSFRSKWLPMVQSNEAQIEGQYLDFYHAIADGRPMLNLWRQYEYVRGVNEAAAIRTNVLAQQVQQNQQEIDSLKDELDAVRRSHSYRLGNLVIRPLSMVKNAITKQTGR